MIDINTSAVPDLVEDAFVNALLVMAQDKEVVSFDMFDTLVTRRVTAPTDAFAEVEKRLVALYGEFYVGFAMERETAELKLRAERADQGYEDVTLDLIYKKLGKPYEDAKDVELAVEGDLLVASKDMLKATRELNVLGKPWIVVSDMYLPAPFLERVLSEKGFSGWKRLYVSGDMNATKTSGSIWRQHIWKDYPLHKILHVGDNEHSDVDVPASLNIAVLPYDRLETRGKTGARLNPHLLPYSYLNRDLLFRNQIQTEEEQWQHLGRSMGSIFVAGFLNWVVERVKCEGIKRLYFCARDGSLMMRAWQAARLMPNVEIKYLSVSRAPLQLTRGYMESNPQWLSPQLVEYLCMVDEATTAEKILRRISKEQNPYLEEDLKREFATIILDRPYGEAMAAMRVILGRHSEFIYNAIAPIALRTKAYLIQEGLADSDVRCALVDTGWHANQQRCINTILFGQVSGLYIGLWRKALGALPKAGFIEAAYTSPFLHQDKEEVSELMQSVNIIESLFTAPDGTTVDYDTNAKGQWRPVTRTNDLEYEQYCTKVKYFQQGVIDVIGEIYYGRKYHTLSLEDCTLEAGRAALTYVCMGPNPAQLRLLGSLRHAFLSDHDNTAFLLSDEFPKSDNEANAVLNMKGWTFGVLLNWYRKAPVAQKSWVRRLVKERLGNMSERRLRPFWK
jgi:FMN phosphatase YigB (HAD superfamily)